MHETNYRYQKRGSTYCTREIAGIEVWQHHAVARSVADAASATRHS